MISITDFTRGDLELLFIEADNIESRAKSKPLEGKVVALAFFEPSTRTRLSFETAVKRLGGSTLLISGEEAIALLRGRTWPTQ